MKIVTAIDSFKGSMTSIEAGHAAKKGILAAHPDAQVIIKPLADGGEGTTDALIEGLNGKRIPLTVTGPFGDPISCYYGYLPETSTAVIEMAAAAGITLSDRHYPLAATTRGLGEMILDAVRRGCRDFIIGIGGSATNDCCIGMLSALGFSFLSENGSDAGEGGQALGKVCSVDISGQDPRLKDCRFRVACDVTNPLCGKNGATYIYGPQKGVTEDMKERLADFAAGYADEKETAANIKAVYEETGYVMDTHTSVASYVCRSYREESKDDKKCVIASTASPYKFVKSVMTAIDDKYEGADEFSLLKELQEISRVDMPQAIQEILDAKVLHTLECDVDMMKDTVKGILKI